MPTLPDEMMAILIPFAVLFTTPTWQKIQVLVIGAVLNQGARRISTILRVMGLGQEKRFERYHRVLNRAQWNGLLASRILLGLLINLLPSSYPILIIVDDTLERRYGKNIKAKGCYRDACRSSENNVVTCFGLKWLCFTLLVPLPWCRRPWALPFLTVLMPSETANKANGRRHKTCIDWTIQISRLISRWLKRSWVLVGDGGFACIRLGNVCNKCKVTLVSRLRLDAALYDLPTAPKSGKPGRPQEKGQRVISLSARVTEPIQLWSEIEVNWYGGKQKKVCYQSGVNLWYSRGEKPLPIRWVLVLDKEADTAEAFFSTDLDLKPAQLIHWFVLRWNIEVTFAQARAHLGIETQRQWSDKAIARTTPLLFGLFSLTCLFGLALQKAHPVPVLHTAWYDKQGEATFIDILALVRRTIWSARYLGKSGFTGKYLKITPTDWDTLVEQLIYAY